MLDTETIVYRILMRRALVLVLVPVPVLWYGVRYDDRWYFHLMRFPATVRHAPFYSSLVTLNLQLTTFFQSKNRRLRKKDTLQYRWHLGEMSTSSLPLEKRYELRIMTA
jgi:hypothetical protein